jgi:hypothetical protein
MHTHAHARIYIHTHIHARRDRQLAFKKGEPLPEPERTMSCYPVAVANVPEDVYVPSSVASSPVAPPSMRVMRPKGSISKLVKRAKLKIKGKPLGANAVKRANLLSQYKVCVCVCVCVCMCVCVISVRT